MKVILDFFTRHGYVIELILSCAVFVTALKRRRRFVWRVVGMVVALFALSFFWGFIRSRVNTDNAFLDYVSIMEYLIYFAVSFAAVYFCFDTDVFIALFFGIAAYSLQHGAYKISEVFRILLTARAGDVISGAVYVVMLVCIYVGAYFLFRKSFSQIEKEYLVGKQVVFLSVPLILYTMIFQYSPNDITTALYLVYAFYDILCCVFTLYIQMSMIKSGRREHEYRLSEHLHYIEKVQYEISKKTIEMVDIKMHDVKHQLRALKNILSPEQISDLERSASLYDMTVKTGNEVLDVIFIEKSLLCEQKNIRFERIVDGGLLGFMNIIDVYSLFENAIDNAIEAVSNVEDTEKRVISLMVRESRSMVFIHLENCFTGKLDFERGLPKTTKSNKLYHGFGTKSMRAIIEKYGGNFTMRADGDMFNLNILIPIPKNGAEKNMATD